MQSYSQKLSRHAARRLAIAMLVAQLVCLVLASRGAGQCVSGQCLLQPYSSQPYQGQSPRSQPAWPEANRSLPAVCRIRNNYSSGTNYGSGVLVERSATTSVVITCAHLFSEGVGEVTTTFVGNREYGARLIDRDVANDLAALLIQTPSVEPMRIGAINGREQLQVCGYGPVGRFICSRGPLIGRASIRGSVLSSLKIATPARPGDSGGVVLNGRQEIVGIIWGVRNGTTYATSSEALKAFLQRISGTRRQANKPSVPQQPKWSATIESRLVKLETQQNNASHDHHQFITRQEAKEFLNQFDSTKFATTEELQATEKRSSSRFESLSSRLKETVSFAVREKLSSSSERLKEWTWGKLVATGLATGSPVGVAVLAVGLFIKRRHRKRVRSKRQNCRDEFP